jgi:hypothetical protein
MNEPTELIDFFLGYAVFCGVVAIGLFIMFEL